MAFLRETHMAKNLEIAIVDEQTIKSKIHNIRGQKVMLDFELAEIYGYTTKDFNRQVKNNIEKFEEDFMFQLNDEELKELSRCKISTLNTGRGSNFKYTPYAFSEQGIYMLMTVLKGELAVKQSKALIRTFKQMKDYVIENQGLVGQREFLQLSLQTTENIKEIMRLNNSLAKTDDKVAKIVDTLGTFIKKSEISQIMLDFGEPVVKQGWLLLNGKPVESDLAYHQIYDSAKKTIYVVDNYIGLKTLVLLKDMGAKIPVTIFSDNLGKGLNKTEYADFCKEYKDLNLTIKTSGRIFHDRYIILDYESADEKIYHCGASSKDSGDRVTTISLVEDIEIYSSLINKLIKKPNLNF